MRIIGLDLGSKTLGVAISDTLKLIARPVETIRFDEDCYEYALKQISEVIKKEKVSEIVLGLPRHMNGDIGYRGEISISFKEMLEETLDVKVYLWDERLTTKVANQTLISANVSRKNRKKVVDQVAAVVILQSYLDSLQ